MKALPLRFLEVEEEGVARLLIVSSPGIEKDWGTHLVVAAANR